MNKLKISARKRAIQVACKALQIDADARHELQARLVGKHSLTEMTLPELEKVLDHLNNLTGRAHKSYPDKPAGIESDPQLQKIEALLADMKLPWRYLTASTRGPSMLKRLAGVDRLEWADAAGKQAIITALVKRQQNPPRST